MFRKISDYYRSGYELEGVSSLDGHDKLLTPALSAKLTVLGFAFSLAGTVVAPAIGIFLGAHNEGQVGFLMALGMVAGFVISVFVRTAIIRHIFNTQWNNRSFRMPEARVLF